MKRLCALLVLSLVIIQLFLFPLIANAGWAPVVITQPATDIGPVNATLNASVNLLSDREVNNGLIYVSDTSPNYSTIGPLYGYFRYGTAPGIYTDQTPPAALGAGAAQFHSLVTGLIPSTTYYVQAILYYPAPIGNYLEPAKELIALLSNDRHYENMQGLGIGLTPVVVTRILNVPANEHVYGNEISFTTLASQIGTGVHGSGGVGVSGGSGTTTTSNPIQMSNITVSSTAISSSKVSPGEKVEITAIVQNKGNANGDAKVTLYVNGQEVESQGIALASGENAPVHFYVSRNDPGSYSVYVGGVSAGTFVVDLFTNNDILIYGLIAVFTLGIAGVLYLVVRKRTA